MLLKHRKNEMRWLTLITGSLMLVLIVPLLAACQKNDNHLLFTYEAPRRCVWSADGASETPVIIGDTIYYLGGYPWNNQIFLNALDKRTGRRLWSTEDGIQKFKVDGDRIFAVGRANLFKREPGRKQEIWLKAVSSKDGKPLWRMNAKTDWKGLEIVAAKDLLYVMANSGLSAINKEKGICEWESRETLFFGVEPNVMYYKESLIAELENRELGFFDCKSGKLTDRVVLPALDPRLPRVIQLHGDHLVVANGDGTLLLINAEKRDKYIAVDVGWINSKLTLTDKIVYFCSGPMPDDVRAVLHGKKPEPELDSDSHFNVLTTAVDAARRKRQEQLEIQKETRLNAIDIVSGQLLWQTKLEEGKVQTAPILFDQFICVGMDGSDSSTIVSVDMRNGQIVSRAKVDTPISNPAFSEGNIVVRGGGVLNLIDAKTGRTLWTFKPETTGLDGSPVAENSIVYIGGKDSNLYAFETDNLVQKSARSE